MAAVPVLALSVDRLNVVTMGRAAPPGVCQGPAPDSPTKEVAMAPFPTRARLIVKHSGKVLAIENASLKDGASLNQYDSGAQDNEKFELRDAGGGYVRIVVKHSGKVLAIENASLNQGASLNQYDPGTQDNEKFELRDAGDGYVRIVVKHSGKVLAIENASLDYGASVNQYDPGTQDNEKFRLEPINDAGW
jgi:nitrite reductase/ring-hydroxylating ferredoxin subunit